MLCTAIAVIYDAFVSWHDIHYFVYTVTVAKSNNWLNILSFVIVACFVLQEQHFVHTMFCIHAIAVIYIIIMMPLLAETRHSLCIKCTWLTVAKGNNWLNCYPCYSKASLIVLHEKQFVHTAFYVVQLTWLLSFIGS